MAELLEAVSFWPILLLVIVFGFAPGFCLRLIVLVYPRSDPRRAELIAELYAIPRIQRPLWVAEQLGVALFESITHPRLPSPFVLASSRDSTGRMQRPSVRLTTALGGALIVAAGLSGPSLPSLPLPSPPLPSPSVPPIGSAPDSSEFLGIEFPVLISPLSPAVQSPPDE